MPARSIARADASISSSGSIVSCITPIRSAGGTDGLRAARRDRQRRACFGEPLRAQSRDAIDEEPLRNDRHVVEAKNTLLRHPVLATESNLGRYAPHSSS